MHAQRRKVTGAATILAAFAVCLVPSLPAADPPQGYVLITGGPARQAIAGNLFRVPVREVVRSDGSKSTVYRDIDYPVRLLPEPAGEAVAANADEVGNRTETEPVAPADEKDDSPDDETKTAAVPAREFSVWVMLGPEYEDPPSAGSSPSPYRLRRPGPAAVRYLFDEYVATNGAGDERLELVLDFSGTGPLVKGGRWSMEAEAGAVSASVEPGYDFRCEQGAYGERTGLIDTPNLHQGPPDVLLVTLAGNDDHRPASISYRLQRQPSD